MRYLLNTNHAVALLNDDSRMVVRLAQPEYAQSDFGITTIALGELYYGAFHGSRSEDNVRRIRDTIIPAFRLFPFDAEAAEEFGRIQAELRVRGTPIPVADAQIAAIARVHRMTLLSSDTHFSSVDNLVVEDWLAD
jgi:tRNA(fMet)-specific endonuclease VapC